MSRLRKFPNKYTCQSVIGAFDLSNPNPGHETVCGEPAVIRCNACKEYFCQPCWEDHYEMTVVQGSKGTGMGMFATAMSYKIQEMKL